MGKRKAPASYGRFDGAMLRMFVYWMNERHSIYMKKTAEKNPPWTSDPILQKYKFTNVFRILDRVSQDLIRMVYEAKSQPSSGADLMFRAFLFRMFNWPDTYTLMMKHGMHRRWDRKTALAALRTAKLQKQQIFTGAYVITNNGSTKQKIVLMCDAIDALYQDRKMLFKDIQAMNTLRDAVRLLREYPMIGGFIAYELACDLTYDKRLMPKPSDAMTWANAGPGAKRGLNRLLKRSLTAAINEKESVQMMRELLKICTPMTRTGDMTLDMRAIEHSLCEFDKYMRVSNGEGRPRSLYHPREEE